MIRSCKNIDIEDWQTVEPWVYECIDRHYKRRDFKRLLLTIGSLSDEDYRRVVKDANKMPLLKAAANLAKEAVRQIKNRTLELEPVHIREMADRSSGKIRQIGKESAMQQIFDYIAKRSCEDIWKRRIVPQQVSSIAGRGQNFGISMIQGWIEADNAAAKWAYKHGKRYYRKCKHYVKLDVRGCFKAMRLARFMKLFRRDCGNEAIIWLWYELLSLHRVDGYERFMIGALPSETAAQYIMSLLYRFAMSLHKQRRGKSAKLINHALLFMDDQIYYGSSRRDLEIAVKKIIKYAADELGLEIKANWHICDMDGIPLDAMGFVVHADSTVTVRPRVFIRARRAALRYLRRSRMTVKQARRLSSYKGYFYPNRRKCRKRHIRLNLKTRKVDKKYKLAAVFAKAAAVVSRYERRKHYEDTVYKQTGSNPVYAFA